MEKLKVAVLEDNIKLLKELIDYLKTSHHVEVITYASNSEVFLENVAALIPQLDALILDIELAGDSMSGLDIANRLKLPVLFVSGKTRDNLIEIEELNQNHDIPVEHISKPITLDKLNKILPKFSNEVNHFKNDKFVYLVDGENRRTKFSYDRIVYLESDTNASSNNKKVYFTDREPLTIFNFSFTHMADKGFNENVFIQPHKSYRVNANKIESYTKEHKLLVQVYSSPGKMTSEAIPVSENYRKDIQKVFK